MSFKKSNLFKNVTNITDGVDILLHSIHEIEKRSMEEKNSKYSFTIDDVVDLTGIYNLRKMNVFADQYY